MTGAGRNGEATPDSGDLLHRGTNPIAKLPLRAGTAGIIVLAVWNQIDLHAKDVIYLPSLRNQKKPDFK